MSYFKFCPMMLPLNNGPKTASTSSTDVPSGSGVGT